MKKLLTAFLFGLLASGCGSPQPAATVNSSSATSGLKAIGDAPDFDVEKIAGGMLNSSELKGKVVIVDFWATWCVPCIQEIPNYNKLNEEMADKDVRILGMTFQSGDIDEVKPKVAEFGMKYPVAMGNDKVEEGFGGYLGLPTTFVIGKDWKIYKKYLGMTSNKKAALEKDIAALLEQTPGVTKSTER